MHHREVILRLLLFMSMLVVPWGSSSDRTSSITREQPATWRVLVYMAADNDLEPAALNNLEELREAPARGGLPLAVQVDRSDRYARRDGDWHGARRFVFRPGLHAGQLTLEDDLGVIDSASPERLRAFLRWGMERSKARHTLVILWGHGRGDRGLLRDEGADDAMSTEGLVEALDGLPIDVLALDLCSMQTLEVAAAIGARARFLVGSQTPRHALGWPYAALLDHLHSRPDIAPKELALWLAEHAGDRGGAFTGSALDLWQTADLAAALSDILEQARQRPLEVRAALATQVGDLPLLSRGARSIDLGAALDVFASELPSATSAARDALARAVLLSWSSHEFSDATGISIRRSTLHDAIALTGRQSSHTAWVRRRK